ncbi:MAG: asparagine synthase (glutamine-hydrolyzing) [Candidatus Aminicenantes bacterium]|nr:asparagine synthase (glutamine-hydrolyzing) [Candidatus Aminicenantes bacterium]
MCGICGIFHPRRGMAGSPILAMNEALRHRGPDDEGYLAMSLPAGERTPLGGRDCRLPLPDISQTDRQVQLWLGHRRLSILDTSACGHQPMSGVDGRLWLTLNGEIYNYLELRTELADLGRRFASRSDSEVLLAAWEAWGETALRRCNGMWAFALLDTEKRELVICRDRFGVKPLYYAAADGILAWASEIKALLALPWQAREANEEILHDYLLMGKAEHVPQTIFQGISELPPAHLLRVDLESGDWKISPYYRLCVNDRREKFTRAKFLEHGRRVSELLRQAVHVRTRSDVPVGTSLSGGVDSSTVACLIADFLRHERIRSIGEHQQVFTACYSDPRHDESRWAEMVVARTDSDWHRVYPSAKSLQDDLEDLIFHQDIPFNSTSIYAHYCLMRLARQQGMTVMLDGQGADELFGGYSLYYPVFLAETLRHGLLGRSVDLLAHTDRIPMSAGSLLGATVRILVKLMLPGKVKEKLRRRYTSESAYIKPGFLQQYRRRYLEAAAHEPVALNSMLADHMAASHLQPLLRYEDRNSMRFHVEVRTPFADDLPLIEYVTSLPAVYKIHNGWSKSLLRLAVRDIVPEAIVRRVDKVGFSTPEAEWLRELAGSLAAYLNPNSPLAPYIDIPKLASDWNILLKEKPTTGYTANWRLLNALIWAKVFRL